MSILLFVLLSPFRITATKLIFRKRLYEPNPCMNGGTCVDDGEGVSLHSCPGGFVGNNCETSYAWHPESSLEWLRR